MAPATFSIYRLDMRKVRPSLVLATVGVCALFVSSCAEPLNGPSLVLTLATPDQPGDPDALHVERFVDEVQRLSEGTIRIDPQWDAEPEGVHDWDQHVARSVADGEFDLALVPGRAWDELGVTTLRALDTPLFVTSLDLVESVLTSDLRGELMAGLPRAGVVGLDIFPSELRHPFGYGKPLLDADDYRDAVIRAPTSATTRMFLERLGATVVDDPPDPRVQRGDESSYGLNNHGDVATGNLTFFPKTETLVMDADVRERLRDDQWEVLQRAAATTRSWLFDNLPSDAESAAEFCGRDGRIVAAGQADIVSFQPAAAEVRQKLEEDEATREIIQAIDDLKDSSTGGPGPVTGCAEQQLSESSGTSALDGVYTSLVTEKALRDAGVTDPALIRDDVARYVWTLADGIWRYEATADHYLQMPHASGHYAYSDGRFTFSWPDGTYISARLEIDRDGTIRFHDLVDSVPELQAETDGFWSAPWRRIGDLPE